MFQIKGIVPGSIVSFRDKYNQTKEGTVLLIRTGDNVIIKTGDSGIFCISKKYCSLVQPVISGRKYTVYGELVNET